MPVPSPFPSPSNAYDAPVTPSFEDGDAQNVDGGYESSNGPPRSETSASSGGFPVSDLPGSVLIDEVESGPWMRDDEDHEADENAEDTDPPPAATLYHPTINGL